MFRMRRFPKVSWGRIKELGSLHADEMFEIFTDCLMFWGDGSGLMGVLLFEGGGRVLDPGDSAALSGELLKGGMV